jgi:Tol biopolymer transport system component
MAPEQALGHAVDARADLFSLGVVLFECLTGQLPFEGATRDAYVQAMLDGRRRSLDALAPSVPPRVRQLVERCLDEDPRRRPASADVIAAELRNAAELFRSGIAGRLAGATGTVRTAWITRGLAAALALGSIGGAALIWRSARHPAPPSGLSIAAAVTDPGANTDPRISPDGRWLSFLSDRDGPARVFIQAMDASTPRPIDVPADGVVSHAWSPNGSALACVAWQKNALVLVVVPAFFGGVPTTSVALTPPPQDVRLARWTTAGIFADVNLGAAGHRLWRIAPDGSAIDDLTRGWNTGLEYRAFDVSADGTMAVAAARNQGHDDLWLAAPDGSRLKHLTDDAFVERNPVWTSRHSVAFQSNHSGQLDLWEIDVASGRVAQLTSSQTVESPGGSTADGSVLAFEQVGQNATLWRLGGRARAGQLTGDALSDLSPSISGDGRQIAFQRTRQTLPEGYPFLDSRIVVAGAANTGTLSSQSTVTDGFAPRLSPDGTWVAYLQRGADSGRFTLQARNLQTGQTRSISATVPLVSMSFGFPVDWSEQKVTWAGPLLVFVEARQDGQRITGVDLSREAGVRTLVPASEWQVHDVRVSPDGLRLAYLRWTRGTFELRVRDLASAAEEIVQRASGRAPDVLLRGWTANGSLIVLRVTANPDGTDRVSVEEAGRGSYRQVATVDRAFAAAARLDAVGTRLYMTRADSGVHNIYEVPLATGRMRQLTDNQQ